MGLKQTGRARTDRPVTITTSSVIEQIEILPEE